MTCIAEDIYSVYYSGSTKDYNGNMTLMACYRAAKVILRNEFDESEYNGFIKPIERVGTTDASLGTSVNFILTNTESRYHNLAPIVLRPKEEEKFADKEVTPDFTDWSKIVNLNASHSSREIVQVKMLLSRKDGIPNMNELPDVALPSAIHRQPLYIGEVKVVEDPHDDIKLTFGLARGLGYMPVSYGFKIVENCVTFYRAKVKRGVDKYEDNEILVQNKKYDVYRDPSFAKVMTEVIAQHVGILRYLMKYRLAIQFSMDELAHFRKFEGACTAAGVVQLPKPQSVPPMLFTELEWSEEKKKVVFSKGFSNEKRKLGKVSPYLLQTSKYAKTKKVTAVKAPPRAIYNVRAFENLVIARQNESLARGNKIKKLPAIRRPNNYEAPEGFPIPELPPDDGDETEEESEEESDDEEDDDDDENDEEEDDDDDENDEEEDDDNDEEEDDDDENDEEEDDEDEDDGGAAGGSRGSGGATGGCGGSGVRGGVRTRLQSKKTVAAPPKYTGKKRTNIPQTEARRKEDTDPNCPPFADYREYTKGQVWPEQQIWDIPSSSEDEDDSPPVGYRPGDSNLYAVPSYDTIDSSASSTAMTHEDDYEASPATPTEELLVAPGPSNFDPVSPSKSSRRHAEPTSPKTPKRSGRHAEPRSPKTPRRGRQAEPFSPKTPRRNGRHAEPKSPKTPRSSGRPAEPTSPKTPRSSGRPAEPTSPKTPRSSGPQAERTSPKTPSTSGRHADINTPRSKRKGGRVYTHRSKQVNLARKIKTKKPKLLKKSRKY